MNFRVRPEEGEEIVFLGLTDVEAIHSACLMEGNPAGWLKKQDLESALGRPANYHHYEGECDLIRLAAIYWHGISVAHGFLDGNKRTGLISAFAFLEANGIVVDDAVLAEEPGDFTDKCFRQKRFVVPVLEHYLRTRCKWNSTS